MPPATIESIDATGSAAVRHIASLAIQCTQVGRPEVAEGLMAVAAAIGNAVQDVVDGIAETASSPLPH
ncbi:hypothetical protein [Azospirillum sp. Sh1]|uniref:hypothetical protein n=1 Tax=Azospirillum sp. Sh1 TaxID=2607285 RepID=UPI0011EC213B|nr:hypothetical protein [Azospirillum sp. Sh1]